MGGGATESLNDLRHRIFEYLATRMNLQNKKLTTNWNIPSELDSMCSFGEQQMRTTSQASAFQIWVDKGR